MTSTPAPVSRDATAERTVFGLLADFADLLDELRRRGVVRSSNNPVADYAEALVAKAFRLDLAKTVATGYDAQDPRTGETYQVKARRLTDFNKSRQRGVIRKLDAANPPFDYLVGVLFERDFRVLRAALVPFVTVVTQAARVDYVGAWRLILRDDVWNLDSVTDVTAPLRQAGESWG
jgi:hypothetical protein